MFYSNFTFHKPSKLGMWVQIRAASTSGVAGGEWSDSRSGHFKPEVRVLDSRTLEGWVEPISGLDVVAKSLCRSQQ